MDENHQGDGESHFGIGAEGAKRAQQLQRDASRVLGITKHDRDISICMYTSWLVVGGI